MSSFHRFSPDPRWARPTDLLPCVAHRATARRSVIVRVWLRTHATLPAKQSGESVAISTRSPECRSEGVRRPCVYACVRDAPGLLGSPVGSPRPSGWDSVPRARAAAATDEASTAELRSGGPPQSGSQRHQNSRLVTPVSRWLRCAARAPAADVLPIPGRAAGAPRVGRLGQERLILRRPSTRATRARQAVQLWKSVRPPRAPGRRVRPDGCQRRLASTPECGTCHRS
jgi:hypothetical protein